MTVTEVQKKHLQEFSDYIDNNLSSDPISMVVLKNDKVRYISLCKEQETLTTYMTRLLALVADFGSGLFFSYIPSGNKDTYEYINMVLPDIKKYIVWRRLKGEMWTPTSPV